MHVRRFFVPALFIAIGLTVGSTNYAQESAGEKIGKKVDEAFEKLSEEAQGIGQEVREGFDKVRAMVDRLSVAGRVYARLHWDKSLYAASISVDVQKDGVALLSGTVPNDEARTSAAKLAQDTVGVDRVINELKVAMPLRSKENPPTGAIK